MGFGVQGHLGNSRGRITDGSVPHGRPWVVCDLCRWPFPIPRTSGNYRRVCRDCRREELAAFAHLMAALAALREAIFGHGEQARVGRDPDRAARIEQYKSRAALCLPVFPDPRPADVPPDRSRYLTPDQEE